ncbi:MAG: hypothetical protein IJH65_10270 [Methanobrevibacter sp.]|nr:hypothetical protein [Methanobrevibacter sp.]
MIIVCILVGAIFGTLTKSVQYERIEITPNGTSIDIPTNEAKYDGEINGTGAKMWTFKQGSLLTYNSEESINAKGLYGLGGAIGFKAIYDTIITHFTKQEKIDGYEVYTINGEQLGIEGRAEMYCIILQNETTHDNIIITADNKDIALHMAQSIQFKVANTTTNTHTTNNPTINNGNSKINNNTHTNDNLQKENDANHIDYSDDSNNQYYDSSSSVETTADSYLESSSSEAGEIISGNLE